MSDVPCQAVDGHQVYRLTVVVEADAAAAQGDEDGGGFGDLLRRVSNAAYDWPAGRPDKVFVSAMITPALLCPSECDDDCETPCHEAHQIPTRRQHEPQVCPGVLIHPTWLDPPVGD
jgi:hypothetical protein